LDFVHVFKVQEQQKDAMLIDRNPNQYTNSDLEALYMFRDSLVTKFASLARLHRLAHPPIASTMIALSDPCGAQQRMNDLIKLQLDAGNVAFSDGCVCAKDPTPIGRTFQSDSSSHGAVFTNATVRLDSLERFRSRHLERP